jgi:hypothetical protein
MLLILSRGARSLSSCNNHNFLLRSLYKRSISAIRNLRFRLPGDAVSMGKPDRASFWLAARNLKKKDT